MVKLIGSSPYLAKDQAKADRATKFIGRGSPRSSTNSYARCFGALANCGKYTADDVVFVSAEGMRNERVSPDPAELALAIIAGVTFITDTPYHRSRPFNIGERQVASFLSDNGYHEIAPGTWRKK